MCVVSEKSCQYVEMRNVAESMIGDIGTYL